MEAIDGYVNAFKLRYVYLDKLFNGRLEAKSKGKRLVTDVNIFINFESLYNYIRRRDVEKEIATAKKKEIRMIYRSAIAEFINVAAHYREYFKRHQIRTNIFYYFNELEETYVNYNNSALVPEYRNHFIESTTAIDRLTINSLIADSIPFMRIITEYIDSVYMVGTKRVEASLIPFIINMEGKFPANMNILIIKDEYDYQYCNNNFLVISKYLGEPVILTKRNIMRFMRHKKKYKEKITSTGKNITRDLNPILLTFILTFLGDRKRSIPGIKGFGFTRIYNQLSRLYDVGYIFDEEPDTMQIQNLCDIFSKYGSFSFREEDLRNEVMTLFKVYDFEYQYSVMSKGQREHILDQLKNKSDVQGLIELNDKYFEYNPLMLMELNNYEKKEGIVKYLD